MAMMRRKKNSLRYRPYRRSVSIHRAEPEVIDCSEDDDDAIVVLYDGVRQQAAAAAVAAAAAGRTATDTGIGATDAGKGATDADKTNPNADKGVPDSKKSISATAASAPVFSAADAGDKNAPAVTAAFSATAAAAGPSGVTDASENPASTPAGGVTSKSQLDYSPWRVSRIPLPADSHTPDLSKTLCATPNAAGAETKPTSELTVNEIFSPFSASPMVTIPDSGTETIKKRPRINRKGPVTSTPAVGALSGKRVNPSGPVTSTPAVPRPDVSEVQDVTPFVITLDEDPSVLEVTEVRRVIRKNTPAVVKEPVTPIRTDFSANFIAFDTSAEKTPRREATNAPGHAVKNVPGLAAKNAPSRPANTTPGRAWKKQVGNVRAKTPSGKKTSDKTPPGKKASGKTHVGKKASVKTPAGKKASGKTPAGKKALWKTPAGKKASGKTPPGKKAATAGAAATTAAPGAVNLESSLEEGELSRTRDSMLSPVSDVTVIRTRPLRRTSSTQRRLQAAIRAARRTLNRSHDRSRSPGWSRKSRKSSKSSKSGRPSKHISRRHMKRVHQREPELWTVDTRGSRFAVPLGATSDLPIRFAPDFSESFARMVEERPKRPIIIDGPNVAYAHGRNQVCSFRGVKIVVDYFKNLGHRCTVFVPNNFVHRAPSSENIQLLDDMYRAGDLAFTPSRWVKGRVVTSYDDRYVVMYATRVGGVIISRDQYRDVSSERPDWRDTIENRLLIPTFVGDQLLLPPDPLGRDGPGLHEFLTFPPGTRLLPEDMPPRQDDYRRHRRDPYEHRDERPEDRRGGRRDENDRNDRGDMNIVVVDLEERGGRNDRPGGGNNRERRVVYHGR